MAALPPLSMSQTKDDLLKHLNMDAETYSLMAVSCAKSLPQSLVTTLPLRPLVELNYFSILLLLILTRIAERDGRSLQMAYVGELPPQRELQATAPL
jgi:hypothetical protein